MAFLQVQDLTRRYPAPGGGLTTVFERLSFQIEKGEFVAIIATRAAARPPSSTSSPASMRRATAPW